MIFKNVANQKLPLYLQDSSGNPKTGEAANITAYISVDGETPQTVTGVTEIGGGFYYITPSQAQTNGHLLTWWGMHATYICRGGAAFTSDAYTQARAQALDKLDIAVSSRAPANTALSNTVWTDTKAAFLDAAISSRLEASSYVAPDNASIASIKSKTDAYLDATVSSRLAASDYVAPDNTSISAIKSRTDAYLDAAVSSRLASSAYVAPDNSSITAIKAKTDKFTFNEDNYVYAVGVGGSGGTDWTDAEKQQIRYRLGIDGTTESPSTNTPHLGNSYSTLDDLATHVSTRLAASDYEAPDNDSIAAIKEVVETNLDAKVSTRLASEDYVDPDNNSISTIKEIVQDKLDEKVSSRLASQSYVAPDNDGISAIKEKTDRLRFDTNDNVYATGLGGGGGVQVVVQPLTASVQRTDGSGGVISGWTYARLVASWNVKDIDLSGHDLRLILYNRNDPASAIVEYSTGAGEITITYNNPDSLVEVDGPDSKTPNAGNYAYVLRDQTTDTVLLSGNCLIQAAPDAG